MGPNGSFWIDEDNKELVLSENNEEQRFYIEDKLNIAENEYLALIPAEEGNYEEDEVLILKVVKNEGEEVLSVIEKEEEFEKVKEYYLNK